MNKQTGKPAEESVVSLERQRLLLASRDDLSRKVLQASVVFGDGLGFDALSFDDRDEPEKLIGVKTSHLG